MRCPCSTYVQREWAGGGWKATRPITRLTRWDEKAGLHGMRYAPNDQRARGAMERRPAVKKISTVAKNGNEIFKEHKLTIGLDLGDRSTHYCILNEAGGVFLEHSLAREAEGNLPGMNVMTPRRNALETATHSTPGSGQMTLT